VAGAGSGEGKEGEGQTLKTPREAEDEVLVRRFVESADRGAFQALVERHLDGLRRLLFVLLRGCREDMEDAEQEILLALFLGLKRFRFQSSFKTYFTSLARNRAIDLLRKKKSRAGKMALCRLESLKAEGSQPEELFIRQARREALLGALLGLEERERLLVLMKEVEGLSIRSIAAALRIPEGTVKSRLHRCREKLGRMLPEESAYERIQSGPLPEVPGKAAR